MTEYSKPRGFRDIILEGAEIAAGISDIIDVETLTNKLSKIGHIICNIQNPLVNTYKNTPLSVTYLRFYNIIWE